MLSQKIQSQRLSKRMEVSIKVREFSYLLNDIAGINKMYPSAGGESTEVFYENGKYYTIQGILVFRMT